jgi:hypothetical protein
MYLTKRPSMHWFTHCRIDHCSNGHVRNLFLGADNVFDVDCAAQLTAKRDYRKAIGRAMLIQNKDRLQNFDPERDCTCRT